MRWLSLLVACTCLWWLYIYWDISVVKVSTYRWRQLQIDYRVCVSHRRCETVFSRIAYERMLPFSTPNGASLLYWEPTFGKIKLVFWCLRVHVMCRFRRIHIGLRSVSKVKILGNSWNVTRAPFILTLTLRCGFKHSGRCRKPNVPNGSLHSVDQRKKFFDHGAPLRFYCFRGYHKNRDESARCDNGIWSFSPECIPSTFFCLVVASHQCRSLQMCIDLFGYWMRHGDLIVFEVSLIIMLQWTSWSDNQCFEL